MTATIVTSENLEAFHAEHLPKPALSVSPDDKPAAKVEADDKPAEKVEEPDESPEAAKKAKLSTRFSELSKARKDAEASAARERERADAAEARAAAAEARLAPPKPDTGKPDPARYADAFKYAEDLAEWTADKKIRDAAKADEDKRERERGATVATEWKGRVEAFKKETPDYEEVLSSSSLAVHDAIRDAIIESELGPDILYALATDDALADRFKIPTVSNRREEAEALRKQLRALGRLEAKLEKTDKPEAKDEEPKREAKRAPDPITPVRGTARGDGPPANPSASEYRAWREAQMGRRTH